MTTMTDVSTAGPSACRVARQRQDETDIDGIEHLFERHQIGPRAGGGGDPRTASGASMSSTGTSTELRSTISVCSVVSHISTALRSADHGPFARSLVAALKQGEYFSIVRETSATVPGE